MIPLEDALDADARVSWQEAGQKGSRTGKSRRWRSDLQISNLVLH